MNGSLEKDDSILEEVEDTSCNNEANNKSMMTVPPS